AAAVSAAVHALALRAPIHLSWAGSVLENPWYRSGLIRALARTGVRARWRAPAAPPVAAALQLATRLARCSPEASPDGAAPCARGASAPCARAHPAPRRCPSRAARTACGLAPPGVPT